MFEAMVIASGLMNGGANMGFAQQDTMSFAMGKMIKNKCAECENIMNVFEGIVLSTFTEECARCRRPLCFTCRDKCTEIFNHLQENAKRTGQATVSMTIKTCMRCSSVPFDDVDESQGMQHDTADQLNSILRAQQGKK